jgi:hypothetical protein
MNNLLRKKNYIEKEQKKYIKDKKVCQFEIDFLSKIFLFKQRAVNALLALKRMGMTM